MANPQPEPFVKPTRRLDYSRKRDRELRRAVFLRDNFTCQHCGHRPSVLPEPPEAWDGGTWYLDLGSDDQPDWWPFLEEICPDHIVPRCWGGPNELANLQTLCIKCNSKKGANHDAHTEEGRREMNQKCCLNCAFFWETKEEERADQESVGECHRHAPITWRKNPDKEEDDRPYLPVWPPVSCLDGCGDFAWHDPISEP